MRTIENIYTSYKCIRCKKTSILISEEVSSTLATDNFLSCSHCGCKKLKKENATSDLRECMKHSSYKRDHGAIRQVRQE